MGEHLLHQKEKYVWEMKKVQWWDDQRKVMDGSSSQENRSDPWERLQASWGRTRNTDKHSVIRVRERKEKRERACSTAVSGRLKNKKGNFVTTRQTQVEKKVSRSMKMNVEVKEGEK